MKSNRTRSAGVWAFVFTTISLMLNILPMGIYIVKGYLVAEPAQKTTLTITLVVAAILLIINILAKLHLRSVFWVVLIGITICMVQITPLLITMAIAVILDEFIFAPLSSKFREKKRINKEIDKRI